MSTANTIRRDTGARHQRKYSNRNPIQRFVLDRFFDRVSETIRPLAPARTLEFGCGEGFFLERLAGRGLVFPDLLGVDLRADALIQAQERNPGYRFECVDLLTWDRPPRQFDLVIASEVLEHLPDPDRFLGRLAAFSRRWLLLTVPWEPWFRIMNLIRGRDLARLGNHPEHVNQWSVRTFRRFVDRHAEVVRVFASFPFVIALARVRGERHDQEPPSPHQID